MLYVKKFESFSKVFDVYGMSTNESKNIKELISSILLDLYKDNIVKIEGFDEPFVAPIHGEDQNKLKSYLNYANKILSEIL